MFLIVFAFKGQVHVFAGRVKIVSHLSFRTRAILKYFCPLDDDDNDDVGDDDDDGAPAEADQVIKVLQPWDQVFEYIGY